MLVSKEPMFRFQEQLLNFIYDKVVFPRLHQILRDGKLPQLRPRITLEAVLSIVFHYLKMDASNLQLRLLDDSINRSSDLSAFEFENNIHRKCFKLENYDFNLALLRIKPQTLVQIFLCLLHERKVVLVSNEPETNAAVMQTLTDLLFPLKWQCSLVTCLQPNLIDYLDAPFPFVVGLNKKLWTEIYSSRWDRLDEDLAVFDLVGQTTL